MTEPDPPPSDSHRLRRWLIGLLLVLATTLAIRSLPLAWAGSGFLNWVHSKGVWAPFVMAAAYTPASLLLVPGSVLTLATGYAFDFKTGVLISMGGSLVVVCIAFAIGRFLLRNSLERVLAENQKFQILDDALARQGLKVVLLTRVAPMFPFAVLNYLYGVSRVRFSDYFLGSLLGMVPGTLVYVYLGSLAKSLSELDADSGEAAPMRKTWYVASVVITIVIVAGLTRSAKQALAAAQTPRSPDDPEKPIVP